jgi:hypothetical protein
LNADAEYNRLLYSSAAPIAGNYVNWRRIERGDK